MEEIWLLTAVTVGILITAAFAFLIRKKRNVIQHDAFWNLGITFIILGIVFGGDRLLGYSFIGIGVLLSIINTIKGLRKK